MLDWPVLIRAGVLGLGLSPESFWNLTPAELRLLLEQQGPAPMTRKALDALMAAYPDNAKDEGDG